MALPPVEYIGSTSIQKAAEGFLITRRMSYPRPPPSDRFTEVAKRHLPKAEADIWPSALSMAKAPAERAPGPTEGIASAMIELPPMRPPLHRTILPTAPPPAAAAAGGIPSSLQLPPPAALLEPRVYRLVGSGFPAIYTGRNLFIGERVYPLTTPERFKALALPIGMAPPK